MTTVWLACYDIAGDRLRERLAQRLIAAGFDRVQYSVFIGPVKPVELTRLRAWIQQELDPKKGPEDSVILLRLPPSELEKMETFGAKNLDISELLGRKNTLFL